MSAKWRVPSKDQSISRSVVCVLGLGGEGGEGSTHLKKEISK